MGAISPTEVGDSTIPEKTQIVLALHQFFSQQST